jgi:hypothetical protein
MTEIDAYKRLLMGSGIIIVVKFLFPGKTVRYRNCIIMAKDK